MLGELSEDQLYTYRSNLYERFFSTIPAGGARFFASLAWFALQRRWTYILYRLWRLFSCKNVNLLRVTISSTHSYYNCTQPHCYGSCTSVVSALLRFCGIQPNHAGFFWLAGVFLDIRIIVIVRVGSFEPYAAAGLHDNPSG